MLLESDKMKNKLYSFVLIVLFLVPPALAQIPGKAKMSFGILGGIGLQNLNGKDSNGNNLANDMILGYHAGINVQIPLVPEFFFQPGILFTTKGANTNSDLISIKYKLSYVELPLNLVYKGLLGRGYVTVGFGPYIAYGLVGKVNTVVGPVSIDSDIVFKNTVEVGDPLLATYFKAFDAGGNIFAGYELASGIFCQLNTQFGMLNINPEDKRFPGNKSTIKNTSFSISIGYRF